MSVMRMNMAATVMMVRQYCRQEIDFNSDDDRLTH